MSALTADLSDELSQLESVDLAAIQLDLQCAAQLPAAAARRFRVLALCRVEGAIVVATSNPRVAAVRQFLASRLREPFVLVRGDEAALRRLLSQVYPPKASAGSVTVPDESSEIVETCDELLRAALLRSASDIHLVPEEHALKAKFRIDGLLEDYRSYPAQIQDAVVSRLKVLAGMNIAEKRGPQDGRFSTTHPATRATIDIRAATIPARYGERVTLRLLTPPQQIESLTDLGMDDQAFKVFTDAVAKPNGLVLLTGPTGCGKSTTLYKTIMQLVRMRGGNIMTVEDPVEYAIPGTTQIEVDKAEKISFSGALRSVLRHDPDIIMLGEIRDAETAGLAIKAALTGHLVFSTLHTNTAAGVATRLVDMGIEPYLVAATLRLAVAQRLVRKLCPHCRKPTSLSASEAAALGDVTLAGDTAYEPAGCVYCAGKGFVGRTALFELLPGSDSLSDLITSGAAESKLLQHMTGAECRLMMEDGKRKVSSGITTAQQVMRAVAAW